MVLYHGSDVIVRNPEVRKTRYAKDFSWGFYCTSNYEQAARWSKKGRSRGIVNVFEYTECNEFDPIYDECRASDFFWATAAVEFAGIDKMTLKEVLAAV